MTRNSDMTLPDGVPSDVLPPDVLPPDVLPLSRAGIDTYRQPVVYMHADCHICRAEGFAARTRIQIDLDGRSVIATLNVVSGTGWLDHESAALSDAAWPQAMARWRGFRILNRPLRPRISAPRPMVRRWTGPHSTASLPTPSTIGFPISIWRRLSPPVPGTGLICQRRPR